MYIHRACVHMLKASTESSQGYVTELIIYRGLTPTILTDTQQETNTGLSPRLLLC